MKLKYKVGDKVLVAKIADEFKFKEWKRWQGKIGTIALISEYSSSGFRWPYQILFEDGSRSNFNENELIKSNNKTKILFGEKND